MKNVILKNFINNQHHTTTLTQSGRKSSKEFNEYGKFCQTVRNLHFMTLHSWCEKINISYITISNAEKLPTKTVSLDLLYSTLMVLEDIAPEMIPMFESKFLARYNLKYTALNENRTVKQPDLESVVVQ